MAANFIQSLKNTIYVGNVPWTIGTNELRKYFAKFGPVARASIVFNKETGLSKRYGFVAFKDENSVKSALQAENHLLDGKLINIALKKPKQS